MRFENSEELYSYIYASACDRRFDELETLAKNGVYLSFTYKRLTVGMRLAQERKLEICEALLTRKLIFLPEVIWGLSLSGHVEILKDIFHKYCLAYPCEMAKIDVLNIALEIATETNQSALTDWLLLQGADRNYILYGAAYKGDETTVKELLNKNYSVTAAVKGAAMGGHQKILFDLLQTSPETRANAIEGAGNGGHLEILQSLLATGDFFDYRHAVHSLATYGQETALMSLLNSSNNVLDSYRYELLEAAIGAAAEKGQYVLLHQLLKKGNFIRMAINVVLKNKNFGLLKTLIELTPESVANKDKNEMNRHTALIYAARCAIDYIDENIIEQSGLFQLGLTANLYASAMAIEGKINLLEQLFNCGINGEPPSIDHITCALEGAISANNQRATEFILQKASIKYPHEMLRIIEESFTCAIDKNIKDLFSVFFKFIPKTNSQSQLLLLRIFIIMMGSNKSLIANYLVALSEFINELPVHVNQTWIKLIVSTIETLVLQTSPEVFENLLRECLPQIKNTSVITEILKALDKSNYNLENLLDLASKNNAIAEYMLNVGLEKRNLYLIHKLIVKNNILDNVLEILIKTEEISIISGLHQIAPFSSATIEYMCKQAVVDEKNKVITYLIKDLGVSPDTILRFALVHNKNKLIIMLINTGFVNKHVVLREAICKNKLALIDELITTGISLDLVIAEAEVHNPDIAEKFRQTKSENDARRVLQQKENAMFLKRMQQTQISSKTLSNQNDKTSINNAFDRCFKPSITYTFVSSEESFSEVIFTAHESKITSLYQLFNKFCKGKNNFSIIKNNNNTIRVKWKTDQLVDLLKGKQASFRNITDTPDPVASKKPQAAAKPAVTMSVLSDNNNEAILAETPNLDKNDGWRKLVKTLTQTEIENWMHELRYACGNIDGLEVKQDESDNCIVVRFPYADKLAIKEPKSNETILVSFNEALDNVYSRIRKHLVIDKKILAHLEKGAVSLKFYPSDSVIGLGYLQDKLYRHFVKKHAKTKQTTIPTKTTTTSTKVKTQTTAEKTVTSVSDIKKLFNEVCRQHIDKDDNFSFLSLAESKESQTNKFKFSFKQIDEMVVHGKKGAIDPCEFFQAIANVLPEVKVYDNRKKSGEVCVIVDLRHTSIAEINIKMAALQQAFVMPEPRKGKPSLGFTITTDPDYIIEGNRVTEKHEKTNVKKIKLIHEKIKHLLDTEPASVCENILSYHLQQLAKISAPGDTIKSSDQIDHLVYLLHATRIFERFSLLLDKHDEFFTQWRNVMRHAYAELDWQTFYQTFNPFFQYLGRVISNGAFKPYIFANQDSDDITRLHKAIKLFECAIKFRTLGSDNSSVERLQQKVLKFFGGDEQTQLIAGSKRKSNEALYQLLMDIYQRNDRDIEAIDYADKKKDALIMLFSLIGENNPTAHRIIKNISSELGHSSTNYEQLREQLNNKARSYFNDFNNNDNNNFRATSHKK